MRYLNETNQSSNKGAVHDLKDWQAPADMIILHRKEASEISRSKRWINIHKADPGLSQTDAVNKKMRRQIRLPDSSSCDLDDVSLGCCGAVHKEPCAVPYSPFPWVTQMIYYSMING